MKYRNNIAVATSDLSSFSLKSWHVFSAVFLFAAIYSSSAFAGGGTICVTLPLIGTICTPGGGGGGGACTITGGGLGDIICNLLAGTALLPTLFSALAYLFGLFLIVMAVIKVKEHVEDPRQVPISEPVKRFVAGGGFFALPIITTAAKNTLTGGLAGGLFNTGLYGGAPTAGGLDAMVFLFIADVFYPFTLLLSGFGYLAGIILVMIGISRMLKSAQEGPKGPGGMGTIFTFLVAGVLFSIDTIMGALTGTLFGTTDVISYGVLAGGGTGDAAVDGHIQSVIGSVVGFMFMIGLIAFVRGIFILREVAEGSGQASLMAAVTHIIGGALAVNIGGVVNAVQTTFGLSFVSFT